MAFKLLLSAGCNDQVSHLRRQKPAQPAHALDFTYLVGDTLFELLVQLDDFPSLLAEFAEKARVLNGNHCLIRESRHQLDLLFGERFHPRCGVGQ